MINPEDYGHYWWTNSEYWDAYYKEELEGEWAELSQTRRSQYFEKYTRRYALKPPLKILYAGVGISLLGELMAHMGHHVTAIDISLYAINFRREAKNIEELLRKCLDWKLGRPYLPEHLYRVPYEKLEAYILEEFNALHQAGGRIKYAQMDWNDPRIPSHGYDIILNQNGLRRANPVETRTAVRSFWRILKPGGLLITSTINALERRDEIIPELEDAGFKMVPTYLSEEEEARVHQLDPLKKHAVYCEMTG